MIEMGRGQELHSRACRRERLSGEERAELDAWYAEMDEAEAKILGHDFAELPTNEELRGQIHDRLSELQATLEKISAIEESNELLRQQNDELKRNCRS